jgi:hypothetical protein
VIILQQAGEADTMLIGHESNPYPLQTIGLCGIVGLTEISKGGE